MWKFNATGLPDIFQKDWRKALMTFKMSRKSSLKETGSSY